MTDAREPLRVAVCGLGYVGLTTAVGLSELGHDVTGVDIDPERVKLIKSGAVPMHEPGLQQALSKHVGAIRFTLDIEAALRASPDIVMIAVQTPAPEGGPPDTSHAEGLARDIGRLMQTPATVVLRSTAPPGTTARLVDIISAGFGARVSAVANPEFLVEGRAFEAFMHPDRIVVGADDEAAAALMARLYAGIDAPIVATDVITAEISKYAANAFLATEISFINEIADLAEAAGADITAISRTLRLDRRIGERAYLAPGLGYGGSCLPKDLRTLAHAGSLLGVRMQLVEAVAEINDRRAAQLIAKLDEAMGGLAGRRIAVWGLAFKGGTDDVRESPAIGVVQRLQEAGADVRAHDPLAARAAGPLVGFGVLCDSQYAALDGAEALLVVTECREFAAPDFTEMGSRMRVPLIVDGRNVMAPEAARAAGFVYLGVAERGAGDRPDAGEEAR